jgi:hypothetical protein
MPTYLLISVKIISGVPAITNSESFHLRISYQLLLEHVWNISEKSKDILIYQLYVIDV